MTVTMADRLERAVGHGVGEGRDPDEVAGRREPHGAGHDRHRAVRGLGDRHDETSTSPSMSTSFDSTAMSTGDACGDVAESGLAVGGSLIGVTVDA